MLESLLDKVAGPHEIFRDTYLEELMRSAPSVISVEVKCKSKYHHSVFMSHKKGK